MDTSDNSMMRPSGLRPPSRIMSPGKALHEISESDSNVRTMKPSRLPPPKTSSKALSKIDFERKTLAERAGEPARSGIAQPPPKSMVKGMSLVGARNTSHASSTSSRTMSSRNTSNSSFASSIGPGVRPQTSYGNRPQASSFSQSTMVRPTTSMGTKRPASSMEDPFDDGRVGADGKRQAFDVENRMDTIEGMYATLKDQIASSTAERNGMDEAVSLYRARITDLDSVKVQLEARVNALQADLDLTRSRLTSTTNTLDDDRRQHRIDMDDLARERRNEMDSLKRELAEENERLMRSYKEKLRECRDETDQVRRQMADELERLGRSHREDIHEVERRKNSEIEDERRLRMQEVEGVKSQIVVEQQNLDQAVGSKEREIEKMRGQLEDLQGDLDREQTLKANLQKALEDSLTTGTAYKCEVQKLEAHVEFLKSDVRGQSDKFVDLERELQAAKDSEKRAWQSTDEIKLKLIKEETLRRILFNQVQELKGNIRVMCRVRPPSKEEETALIAYPDLDKESKELEIQGPEEQSSLGKITRKPYPFTFDRVFGPATQNVEVFEEISQLVQSALDGYNVCIFCYGQTGAGKTHTMSSADGMIPRATHQIYARTEELKEKGWTYSMEGSFVEVYNEEIHDLLGNPKEFDKKKHEIRHDETKKQTTVTNLKTVVLESADTVEKILQQADTNRSVAATKSNERSSRSHSVFILKLIGKNSATGETSEGTLNLVDLAGSERLKISGAEGDRMKETQNINKSLSCLGDVIGALGQGQKEGGHIPYRNSKLTYLLQYSLGGNSKTLMFVMISPLEAHLKETLTSLKFATKVHNTHIGTAKKSTKGSG